MALPPPPKAATSNVAPASAPTPAATEASKPVIKQFGRAKDDAGVAIPAPKPLGIDLVELSKELFTVVEAKAKAADVSLDDLVEACKLDKPNVPGHKEGRIAYSVAATVINLTKAHGLLNKQRGPGGFAVLKNKNIELEQQLAKLTAQLAALGVK